MFEHRGFDDDPDPYFCNSELYSQAENINDDETLENEFYSITRLQRFWLNLRRETLPVWGLAVRAWHRLVSIRRGGNLPDDIPF